MQIRVIKNFLFFLVAVNVSGNVWCQSHNLRSFSLSSIRLLEGPFRHAQETDLKYMLQLDPDKLLAPFVKESGLDTSVSGYGNWEGTGLNGHIGGHYLSALSNMYASTGNAELHKRLIYFIDVLESCQVKNGDGYVGGIPGGKAMWKELAAGRIDAGSFSLNKKWVPLYNIHKLYAGLVDAYSIAGIQKAKDILINLSDWLIQLTSNLTDIQIQEILRSEHGGLNEVFADVYAFTGDQKYLAMARRLSHRAILLPLLQGKDSLTGLHANTQIPKVVGFMAIAALAKDSAWAGAANFFWNTVVANRTVSIGGNSVREHFHPAENFSSMLESREGPETCNTYNMLKLSKRLFLWNAKADYMNYYERALYNHILSSQHPRGGFVYFTPMRPRHYRVYSQPQEGFWCCVGSGLENHGKYGELIYAHNDKDIFINLFIPSILKWKEKGIRLTQDTRFPYDGKSTISLSMKTPTRFSLYIRQPSWLKASAMNIRVNNQQTKFPVGTNSYIKIERLWETGDIVSISLPMETIAEYLPDKTKWVSFVHGPIVLAAITDTTDLTGLRADDSRMGHIAGGALYPIDKAPLILASQKSIVAGLEKVKGKPLAFKAPNLMYPATYNNVELIAFFQIHDARYMVYWRVADDQGLKKIQQDLMEKEKAALLLESLTVDHVAPGEQQPESDHNFRGDKTESGVYLERHWRSARGWFSYDLKNRDKKGVKLRVTYHGGDRNRNFDIYVNNILLKTVRLDGGAGEKFFDVDYPLIAELVNDDILQIKFVAHTGSTTGAIYYLRLMKNQ